MQLLCSRAHGCHTAQQGPVVLLTRPHPAQGRLAAPAQHRWHRAGHHRWHEPPTCTGRERGYERGAGAVCRWGGAGTPAARRVVSIPYGPHGHAPHSSCTIRTAPEGGPAAAASWPGQAGSQCDGKARMKAPIDYVRVKPGAETTTSAPNRRRDIRETHWSVG